MIRTMVLIMELYFGLGAFVMTLTIGLFAMRIAQRHNMKIDYVFEMDFIEKNDLIRGLRSIVLCLITWPVFCGIPFIECVKGEGYILDAVDYGIFGASDS